jgi:putative oxidoreductase
MVHHGFDKIQNVDGFSANVVAKFFGFLPGPPQFWTLSAAATQIAGAGLLGLGVLSRPVAASMATTMVVAVVFHLLNTGGESFPLGIPKAHSYNFELAAMYVLVLGYFTVSGAGKYSVDEQILGGEIKIYQGLFNKVFGDA